MIPVLRDLDKMIGLEDIKCDIVDFIIYHLQTLCTPPGKKL